MIAQLESLDRRIPRWTMNRLRARKCPFCGSENEAILERPDKLPVALCATCRCWYVAEVPQANEIQKLYDTYWRNHRAADLSETVAIQKKKAAERTRKTDLRVATLSQLLDGLEGKRVLDVGCGMGDFLLSARLDGAEVIGCDLSPEACEFVEGQLGIPMYQSELQELADAIGPVDAVTMFDLIEHPVEPMVVLRAACEILRPGGILLFHTPNGGAAGTSLVTAKDWLGFRVDLEHLQYLSAHTVNWFARECHMSIERLNAFGYPDLKALERISSPGRKTSIRQKVKEYARRWHGVERMLQALRGARAALRDSRFDSYHLFAALRKL